jgi:hypothetical protein
MRNLIYFIPIATTIFAFFFTAILFRHYIGKKSGPHLLWWATGVLLYGVGTLVESLVSLLGWNAWLFRSWYISGALLGGAPLAQGTVYLLLHRRTANRLAILLVLTVLIAATFVIMTPLNTDLVEPFRLSGKVIEWQWVRFFSPFINTYAFIFLVGGAVLSAIRYKKQKENYHRFIGNVLIAVGALLPGIGGAFTRFGHTEVLYVTEFIGIVLIYLGYHSNVEGSPLAGIVSTVKSAQQSKFIAN